MWRRVTWWKCSDMSEYDTAVSIIRVHESSKISVHFYQFTRRRNLVDSVILRSFALFTPRSRVLPEKLTGSHLVKKFPAFYGTQKFITAFTSVRHLSLSWASSIQSIPPHPTSWRPILILSSRLRLSLPSGLFPSRFPTKACTPLRHTCYMPH
jgi:hypothetical protein